MSITIEHSLRQRASRSRYLAILCLGLSVIILVCTYASLPWFADKTLNSMIQLEGRFSGTNAGISVDTYIRFFPIATLFLGVFVVSFACFLLGRIAFIEIELAVWFGGLADALCMAGNDFGQFEKAATLFVPKSKYLSNPEILSTKNIALLADVLKQTKKTVG